MRFSDLNISYKKRRIAAPVIAAACVWLVACNNDHHSSKDDRGFSGYWLNESASHDFNSSPIAHRDGNVDGRAFCKHVKENPRLHGFTDKVRWAKSNSPAFHALLVRDDGAIFHFTPSVPPANLVAGSSEYYLGQLGDGGFVTNTANSGYIPSPVNSFSSTTPDVDREAPDLGRLILSEDGQRLIVFTVSGSPYRDGRSFVRASEDQMQRYAASVTECFDHINRAYLESLPTDDGRSDFPPTIPPGEGPGLVPPGVSPAPARPLPPSSAIGPRPPAPACEGRACSPSPGPVAPAPAPSTSPRNSVLAPPPPAVPDLSGGQ